MAMATGVDDPRSIRVFVSSTFRDMHAEREELVKFVFPRLRRLCEDRAVAWSEVDLRWGVTDEQKAEGAVLPICMAEIDRSRPYFIGLLGQRYGWVPEELPEGLTDQLPWFTSLAGRSVTELEILHGVLDAPPGDRHAFFYLRDPEALAGLSDAERAELEDPDAELRARLDELRTRVRTSGFPCREYGTPRALADAVLADFTRLLDELYPLEAVPARSERDAAAHRAFGTAATLGRTMRGELVAALDRHALSAHPPLVLAGEPGSGASSLSAMWLDRWRSAHTDDVVVEHHALATTDSSDWRTLASRLEAELAAAMGSEASEHSPAESAVDRRAALFAALASAATLSPRRVVVLVDGADLLDDVDGAPDLTWLPRQVPPNVRVVVTTSSDRPVDAARHRGWPVLEIPPLDERERRETVSRFLGRYAKRLDEVHVARIVSAPATGNELYLVTVLDELRQHGDHFTLAERIDWYLGADTLDALLERVLARYEDDFDRDRPHLVRDSMRAIASARRGLTEPELLETLGTTGDSLPHAVWSPLALAAESGLSTRTGLLRFATDPHRRAATRRYLAADDDRRAAHATLAQTFAKHDLSPRVVEELPWQQLWAGEVDQMVATLRDPHFTDVAARTSITDLRRLWARAEESGRSVVDAYRPVLDDPGADVDLLWVVARLVTDAGHPAESAAANRGLVARLRGATDERAPARLRAALVNLGAALWTQAQLDGAEAALREAADAARAAGDDVVLHSALGNLGLCRRDRGDLAGANAILVEDEQISRRIGDPLALQASLGNRAQVLRQLGDDEGALALIHEQEEICRSIGDTAGVARALAGQGAILGDRGRLEESLARFHAYGAASRELGDLHGLAESMVSEIHTLRQLGRRADAEARALEAEALVRRMDDRALLARVLDASARLAAEEGRWPDVARFANEAALTSRSAGVTAPLVLALGMLGTARRELGDLRGAREAHSEEERVASTAGDPAATATALCNLAAVDIAEGALDAALARYAQAEPILCRLNLHMVLFPMLSNRWQVHLARNDPNAAIADALSAAASAGALGARAQQRDLLATVAELMYSMGRMGETGNVWRDVASACRALGDDAGLQRALGELALIVMGEGRLDETAALLDEQEAICRRIGEMRGLAACIGNRAILLRQRGDLAGALACVEEQYAIAAASGDGQGALFATANRGELLGALGRTAEGLAELDRARAIAASNGLTPMVAQLDQMIAALRAER